MHHRRRGSPAGWSRRLSRARSARDRERPMISGVPARTTVAYRQSRDAARASAAIGHRRSPSAQSGGQCSQFTAIEFAAPGASISHYDSLPSSGAALSSFFTRERSRLRSPRSTPKSEVRGGHGPQPGSSTSLRRLLGQRTPVIEHSWEPFDLKQYVEITVEGREYLALRAQLAAATAQRRAES
jgi:hypothetical protein